MIYGKRTQCSFLCPLGAINSLSNYITPFTIRIDKNARTECYKCVDTCSKNAIHYGIRGVPAGTMKKFSRNLYLFVSFLFIAVFSAGSIVFTVKGLLDLIF